MSCENWVTGQKVITGSAIEIWVDEDGVSVKRMINPGVMGEIVEIRSADHEMRVRFFNVEKIARLEQDAIHNLLRP